MTDELKLMIDAEELPASEVAQILTDLDKSFTAFVGRQGGRSFGAKLSVRAVRAGSIEILLDAIDGLGKLYAARQFLAPFASHLAQLVELATGLQLHKAVIKSADRKAISSLASPVASGLARQINIVNNGTIVLNVDSAAKATAILEGLTAPIANNDAPPRPASLLGITKRQLVELEQGELMGSALLVDDAWYARLVRGQGVLVPISGSVDGLRHGRQYAFRGSPIRGRMGETVGIHLSGATEIGGK